MRKRLLITAAAIILSAGSITGGTMAVYHAVTHTDKTISTSSIGVSLNIDNSPKEKSKENQTEKQKVLQRVSAQNTGDKPQYVRVKIDKTWLDNNNVITQKNGESLNTDYIGINYVNTEDWIFDDTDYLYYKKIVYPGEKTSAFMDSYTILSDVEENTNIYSDLSVKLEYEAEAIQTIAAKPAMLYEWGVVARIDDNGDIVNINNPDEGYEYELTDDITEVLSKEETDKAQEIIESQQSEAVPGNNTVITLDDSATGFSVVNKDIDFCDMQPGETREGIVKLFNNSDEKTDFYINSEIIKNIADEGLGTGIYNIKIYKGITKDNDKETGQQREYSVLYDGMIGNTDKASYNNILVSDQLLTSLSPGESADIRILVSLDGKTVDNSYMNKQGKIRLNISATQSEEAGITESSVKTGDTSRIMLYGILALISGIICIAVIIALYIRKRGNSNTIK